MVQIGSNGKLARGKNSQGNVQPLLKYSNYTPLILNLEYIYNFYNHTNIPLPHPMKNLGKNTYQFCHYHNSLRHWMSACFVLRDVMEQLIQEGSLRQFVDQTWEAVTPQQAVQKISN